MKVSKTDFNLFEQHFLMEHLKDSSHRYGQAFLNEFQHIHDSLTATPAGNAECLRLWNEWDPNLARRHCLKWVEQ